MTRTPSPSHAIIQFTLSPKNATRINYSRRMYAIVRRYTPDVVEGASNECLADLTGLRTFFKMSYVEIAQKIQKELVKEIGFGFTVRVATSKKFNEVKGKEKKQKSISTYKEINTLFAGASYIQKEDRTKISRVLRKKLVVPFIGKVS